jgi:hypothetical protein
MFWTVPRMWEGGECYIIGGGSSLARQFNVPNHVIELVETGQQPISAYSEYFKPLHDKHVIGTNIGFMLGDWVSIGMFCDKNFYWRHKDAISRFKGLMVTDYADLGEIVKDNRNIKVLKRDNRNGVTTKPDIICWNFNTGAAAINLALLMGVKKIYLLGYDMAISNDRSHWHEGFQLYERKTSPKQFDNFLKRYPQIAQEVKTKYPDVEIINCNPDSALDVWPKVRLNEVL